MRDYEGGPSKGFGFVCFQTPEEALNAMQLHNQIIDDRPIYVQRAQKREERRAQLETQFARNQYKQMIPPQIPYMSTFPYFQGMPMGRQGPYPIIPQIFGRNVLPNRNPMGQYGRNVQYPIPAYTTFNNPNIPSSNQNNSQQNPQNQPYPKKNYQQNSKKPNISNVSNIPPNQNNNNNNNSNRRPPNTQQVSNVPQIRNTQQQTQQPTTFELTAQTLAAASPETQKNMLGESLYPLIFQSQPELAGKITGMLLEMDNGELLHLLESPESLQAKVQEALAVLERHRQGNIN